MTPSYFRWWLYKDAKSSLLKILVPFKHRPKMMLLTTTVSISEKLMWKYSCSVKQIHKEINVSCYLEMYRLFQIKRPKHIIDEEL
jgi:hypothetical protein